MWDIDKTYLMTELAGWRDLLKRRFESAIDKHARPGAVPILRALRRGTEPANARTPLYFVSASPPEMRTVLEQKMVLDGVEADGIAFKDHWRVLRRRGLRELRRHVPYKLTALLEYRAVWPPGGREWLFGDDAESDPFIYSIYAAIRRGELAGESLSKALEVHEVLDRDQRAIVALAKEASERAPPAPDGSVDAIYIFRAAATPRPEFEKIGGITFVEDAVALAKDLVRRGRIAESVIPEVEREVRGAPLVDDQEGDAREQEPAGS